LADIAAADGSAPAAWPHGGGGSRLRDFCGLLTYATVAFTRALLDDHPAAIWIAGLLLVVNVWRGWYHFKQVQLQIPMTAAMMLATAAMIRARWMLASAWLTGALIVKPLALVMMLLAGALVPRMRLLLIAGIVLAVALPFALLHWDYLIGQYQALGLKIWRVATAPPGEWIYQADFTTLLRAFGIVLPGSVSLAIRLLAALGTLRLAWRVQGTRDRKAFALALLILSGLYITLFEPRNENVSYLVATSGISALAFLILLRDVADLRGPGVPGPRLRGERASRRGDQAHAHARYLRLGSRPDGAAAPLVHARRRRGVVNKHR